LVVEERVQLPPTVSRLIRNEITAQTAVTVTTHEILAGDGSVATTFATGESQLTRRFHLARLTTGCSTLQHATMMMLKIACRPRKSTCTRFSILSRAFIFSTIKVPQGATSPCRRTNYVCKGIHSTRYTLVQDPSCRLVPSLFMHLWSGTLCQCKS
jgi:hypothetical protein